MRWRGFAKYLGLQVPEALLFGLVLFWAREWLGLPLWSAFVLLGLWIVKDLAMYPFVRRVFEGDVVDRVGVGRLIGEHGVAEEEITSSGYVRVKGELWRAESTTPPAPIPLGSRVRVREVRGLTLLIEPVERP